MCGRLSTAELIPEDLKKLFALASAPPFLQKYNIAPTLQIPAIREQNNQRTLDSLRWGLIPHWVKDQKIKVTAFNARLETLTQKPFFRDPIRHQRCIIPASGFYEWQKQGDKKQPYYIYRADHTPLALAGLWDRWVDPATGEKIESCTIVTLPATHPMQQIHERMPAVLEPDFFDTWLDPGFKETHLLRDVLSAPKEGVLEMYPVSSYVSNAAHDGEKCKEQLIESGA